jgi:hypothetical protein
MIVVEKSCKSHLQLANSASISAEKLAEKLVYLSFCHAMSDICNKMVSPCATVDLSTHTARPRIP